jgi:hypothetical protein
MEIVKQKEPVTYRSFSLEDHIRAHMKILPHVHVRIVELDFLSNSERRVYGITETDEKENTHDSYKVRVLDMGDLFDIERLRDPKIQSCGRREK